jgi:excisionase family DNA binding protein
MNYSVTEAARAVGKSRTTIIRAIAAGTLSATRDDPGKPWTIDAAELARAFPDAVHEPLSDRINDLPRTGDDRHEPVVTRDSAALIAAHEATITDLRRRLDIATAQLGEALSQVRALTDQRAVPLATPRRSWLPWRKG